jgi:hypothetical protein
MTPRWSFTATHLKALAELMAQEVRRLPVLEAEIQDLGDLLQDFLLARGRGLIAKLPQLAPWTGTRCAANLGEELACRSGAQDPRAGRCA